MAIWLIKLQILEIEYLIINEAQLISFTRQNYKIMTKEQMNE